MKDKPLKNQSIDTYAASIAGALLASVSPKRGSWRKESWERIHEALGHESEAVREGSPVALVVYEYLLHVAAAYLASHFDRDRAEEFVANVRSDLDRFGYYFTRLNAANSFTIDELGAVVASRANIISMIGTIERSIKKGHA